MKKKNIPKILNFDSDLLEKNNSKKIQTKKKKNKNKFTFKSKHAVEYQDINKVVSFDSFKLNKIDYCTLEYVFEKTEHAEEKQPNIEIVILDDSKKNKKEKSQSKVLNSEKKELAKEPKLEESVQLVLEKTEIEESIKEKKPIETTTNKYSFDKNDVLLEVINLKKQYTKKAKPAIDMLNFKVLRGQFHAFIGANGAGKTTTIKSIVGAYANFEGQVKISGLDNREKMSKAKLGYIPEIARFPARISAFNYLKSMAMLNRLTPKEAEEFTKKILIEFKMYDLKDVSPNKFSSGQKKKILLAQALSNNPDILIMDEPAANLDPKARIDFFNILKNLQKQGKSIFISSHILSELDLYADSLTILDGGKIVFTGSRQEEIHEGNKYVYRVNLFKEDDFGKYDLSKFTFEKNVEEPKNYIVSCNDKKLMDDFLGYLFKNNKTYKVELFKLSIEDMYKKYVVFGSVHTGYKQNANTTLNNEK